MTTRLLLTLAFATSLTACAYDGGPDALGTADGALTGQQTMCGGIAAFPCPDGQTCLIKADYPDASGVCVGKKAATTWHKKCDLVKCPLHLCPDGQHLLVNPANCCGTCVGQPKACPYMALCIAGYAWDDKACNCLPIKGTACGPKVCAAGTVCCNESCGICTEPGGVCTQQLCAPVY